MRMCLRTRRQAILVAVLSFALLGWAGSAGASGDADGWSYRLAHELMSPFCPGRTLSACTSGQAAELRQWIVMQEAAGTSRDEVVAILEQRFGDVIRSRPEAEGWGMAAWLLPVVAALAGLGVAFFALRRMVAPQAARHSATATATATAAGPGVDIDPELERLVDQELRAGDA
jgi:cytochrome c-type biogenesis protein CcmH/NrfF